MSPLGSLGSPQTPALPGRKSLLAEPWGVGGTYSDHHSSPTRLPRGSDGKEPACQCRKCRRWEFNPWVRKIPLEKEMTKHPSILAWRTPQTEEPGRSKTTGSQRVGHDWAHTPACTPAPTEFLFQPWLLKLFLVAVLIIIVCSNQSGRLRSNNKKVIINIDKDSSNEKNDWSAFQGRQGSQNTES